MLEKAWLKGMECAEGQLDSWREGSSCVADSSHPSLGWTTLGFVACKATGNSEAMLCGDHRGAPGIYAGNSRTS